MAVIRIGRAATPLAAAALDGSCFVAKEAFADFAE